MAKGGFFASGPYRTVLLVVVGLLACSILTFGFLHTRERQLAAARDDETEFTGVIEADEVITSFKVPGKIESLLVNEGDTVKKGQVLARLETDELEVKAAQARAAVESCQAQITKAQNAVGVQSGLAGSQVEQARAAVEQAGAGLDIASATWERIRQLYESGAVSAQQRDEAEAQYKAAQGKLNEARAALDKALSAQGQVTLSENDVSVARTQLEQARAKYDEALVYLKSATLTAPMDGIITLRAMKAGETVGAGTPVLKITDIKNTWVKVYVSEKKIGRVKLGQKVKVSVPAFPDRHFDGVVTWINAAGDFATQKAVNDQYDKDIRSFEVKVGVPNPKLLLKTGMTATVDFGAGD